MYIAVNQDDQRHPFMIHRLNEKVYTFEGFCYYLYHQYEVMVEALNSGAYMEWLSSSLNMTSLVGEIKEIMAREGQTIEITELLLDKCAYTAHKSIKHIHAYHQMLLEMPVHIQHKRLGNSQMSAGNYRQALVWYKKAQRIQSTSEVENNIGVAYLMLNDYGRALKHINKSIHQDDLLEKRLNRIKAYLMLTMYDEALGDLNHIRGLNDTFEVWYGYGLSYEGLGRIEEALAAYKKAYEVNHKEHVVYRVVALAVSSQKDLDLELWMKREHFSQKMLYYIQAHIVKRTDDSNYALLMDKVIEEDGSDLMILMELAKYYCEKRQIIKALEYIRSIPSEHGEEEEVLYQKALIAKAAGNRDSYDDFMTTLTNRWKDEVRKNTLG